MKTPRSCVQFLLATLTCVMFSSNPGMALPKEKYKLEQMANGVFLRCELFTLRVAICTDRIVHVTCAPGQQIPEKQSLSVTGSWAPASWILDRKADKILLKTAAITVEIDPATILCRFTDHKGNLLIAEKERAFSPVMIGEEPSWNVFETFKLTPDEGIYGLGQHQYGWMNHRGKEVTLIQTNTTAVNPFLVSTQGWGILWDNYSKTYFRDDRSNGATFWSEYGNQADYYLFFGDDMERSLLAIGWLRDRLPCLENGHTDSGKARNVISMPKSSLMLLRNTVCAAFPLM
ncbi:MAG: hypothetical protein V1733_11310 [bacterium]